MEMASNLCILMRDKYPKGHLGFRKFIEKITRKQTITSDLRDYQRMQDTTPWAFCPCTDLMSLECVINRMMLSHTLMTWEWILKANSLLSEADDFIMLSEAKVDRRVIAYIRLYLFEEVSTRQISADDAIRVISTEPNEVKIRNILILTENLLSGDKLFEFTS